MASYRYSKYTDEYIDSFIKNNELKIKRIGSFNYDKRTVTFQCTVCNYIWDKDPVIIIKKLRGCAQCACRLKITNEIIDERLVGRSVRRLGNVGKDTKENIKFSCNNCNYVWNACPHNIIHKESNCPKCNKSYGEKTIGSILEKHGIEFVSNYNIYIFGFINGEHPKLIDFYLPYYNLFIEYNGRQHYEPIRFGGRSLYEAEKKFEKQLIRDQEVRDFALNNNIKILEIDARKFKNKNLYSNLESHIYYELSNIEAYEHSMGRILGYPPEEYPTCEEILSIMKWTLNE
jgi:hypothetical protein